MGKPRGTADPEMVFTIDLDGSHNGAVTQEALYYQSVTRLAVVMTLDVRSNFIVFDVIQSADVKRSMRPRAVGQPADNVTDSAPAFDQEHVANPQFMSDSLKIAQRESPRRLGSIEPAGEQVHGRIAAGDTALYRVICYSAVIFHVIILV